MIAILAFGGIAALLAVLYLFVLPKKNHAATAPVKAAIEQPGPAGAAAAAHPMAKHLEIAGIRVTAAPGGKVRIQYAVVNHSAASLSAMKMMVTLVSADRSYFEFPTTIPSLGPYEAKDLTTTVTSTVKPYEMPDWQMFRARFRITE